MFDVKDLPAEKVPYLGLLKSVLGYVDTAHYTYGELTNEINAETGGIMCGVEVFDHAESIDEFQAFFSVRGKTMYPKTDVLFKMIREILNTSSLEDTRRLHEIISQVKSRAQSSLVSARTFDRSSSCCILSLLRWRHFRMRWQELRIISLLKHWIGNLKNEKKLWLLNLQNL